MCGEVAVIAQARATGGVREHPNQLPTVVAFWELNLLKVVPASKTQVERDEFCSSILLQRMEDKLLADAPLFRDVTDFKPDKEMADAVQGLVGGFPCQAAET